jgi:putative spermidine/putrescine transport system permease protein
VSRVFLRVATGLTLGFLYLPLVVIGIYAFNAQRIQIWPIKEYSLRWFGEAYANEGVRDAFTLSIVVALQATLLAIVLGSLASFAVHRFRFFGRETIAFALVLPIALPGIITGMALIATIHGVGVSFGTLTIVVGHATFCVVVVYNNVIARLRRTSRSIEEASMDLGADPWQTFRHVTFPTLRTAIVAAGLLAFALSFDEIIVTTFTAGTQETIPIWIFNHLRLPNQRPIVNVVALVMIGLSMIPVYLAQRLSSDTTSAATVPR